MKLHSYPVEIMSAVPATVHNPDKIYSVLHPIKTPYTTLKPRDLHNTLFYKQSWIRKQSSAL